MYKEIHIYTYIWRGSRLRAHLFLMMQFYKPLNLLQRVISHSNHRNKAKKNHFSNTPNWRGKKLSPFCKKKYKSHGQNLIYGKWRDLSFYFSWKGPSKISEWFCRHENYNFFAQFWAFSQFYGTEISCIL